MSDSVSYGIRLWGLATGEPTQFDGEWLSYYNPRAFGGRGEVETTRDPTRALRFTEREAALKRWQASAGTRPDGKPNRPLTAWNVSVERLPE